MTLGVLSVAEEFLISFAVCLNYSRRVWLFIWANIKQKMKNQINANWKSIFYMDSALPGAVAVRSFSFSPPCSSSCGTHSLPTRKNWKHFWEKREKCAPARQATIKMLLGNPLARFGFGFGFGFVYTTKCRGGEEKKETPLHSTPGSGNWLSNEMPCWPSWLFLTFVANVWTENFSHSVWRLMWQRGSVAAAVPPFLYL